MSVFSGDALAGTIVLVTGASRGIGRASAEALAHAGARLVLSARDLELLEQLASDLADSVLAILPADLSEPGQAGMLAARASEVAPIDVLVNCAGIAISERGGGTVEQIDRMMEINLRSPLTLCQELAAKMAERGRGAIVNVSSIVGVQGIVAAPAYSASKGGIDAMTRALAFQYGSHGVRVNVVSPGFVATDFSKVAASVDGVLDAVARSTAIRTVATAGDIADVVVFLSSDAARFVTGQIIVVDGGFTATKELIPAELFTAALNRKA